MTNRTSYSGLIRATALRYGLDPDLLEAQVIVESSGNAHAYRFEPKFWARYLSKLPAYKNAIPQRVSASYGLMQIMYPRAVEAGYVGDPEGLFVPEVNLRIGCQILVSLRQWAHGSIDSMLAAYNGGKADNEPGHQPRLRNQVYATAVLATRASLPPLS